MAKLIDLNFKRNVNVFTNGNPERAWPHVLQTVGLGKASLAIPSNVTLETGDLLITEDSLHITTG
jgi:hypothetical protein